MRITRTRLFGRSGQPRLNDIQQAVSVVRFFFLSLEGILLSKTFNQNALMHFEQGGVYHIYNQGNNGRRIFLREGHYQYFIQKMRQQLTIISASTTFITIL